MQRRPSPFSLVAVGLAVVLVAGCAPNESTPPTAPSAPAAAEGPADTGASSAPPTADDKASTTAGTAVLSYGDTTYTAELAFCAFDESGEALFHGPAKDAAGDDVGYLDGDFLGLTDIPSGEARIDFGATRKLQSTDEFVAIGSPGGHIVIGDFDDANLIVIGAAWQQDGTELPTANLRVAC